MSNSKTVHVLQKIIGHIDHTLEYCQGQSFDAFMDNRMLQEACVFNVLQIGELSKNALDAEVTEMYPAIPWRQMYGLRNRIAHDYEGIQLKIVWTTITSDFPALRQALQAVLNDYQGGSHT